jgi:hypothetical protein
MRFMVIVKGCEAEKVPSKEFLAAMGKYNADLEKAGVLVALEGLVPPAQGTKVKFGGKTPTVTDGPFAESKELLGGFWLWKCKSKQEAIEWLKRAPFEDKEVEIRQLLEPAEFSENFAREYRAVSQREKVEVRK